MKDDVTRSILEEIHCLINPFATGEHTIYTSSFPLTIYNDKLVANGEDGSIER